MFLRPVEMKDAESLLSFSRDVGFGFTTLPKDKKIIEEKIALSQESFAKPLDRPFHESYLFVLELNGEVIGCSALVSRIGMDEPFYAYHNVSLRQQDSYLNIQRDVAVLHFIEAIKKPTEICTLFLKKEHRRKEWGRFLSLARFLFIASNMQRFAPIVIAELRGYSDEAGHSPFFEAIGKPFLQCSFDEANFIRYKHPETIAALFPHHPIYPVLLPQDAGDCIGKLHPDTAGAEKILKKQGFLKSHYVDILDAGPHLFAHTEKIHAVEKSVLGSLSATIVEMPTEKKAIVATEHCQNWRAILTDLSLLADGSLSLPKEAQTMLRVEPGQSLRYYYPN